MDPVIPHHPRGGPFPHLQHGYHAELPRVIQHTRGLIHAGTEPMEVGRFILKQAHALALGVDDLRCALGYLLSAAITAGGLAVIRSRLQFSVSAADAGELMEPLGSLRCGDCGDVALPTHRCPAAPTAVRLRCCQFHELGGDARHGCGGDAPPRTAPRPRPPGDGEGA